ncbi:MAG: septum formation initiator family protein [Clostridiales bacterium]|jgi:cell division protein FtsB|nr:septum formation initiator family protein [Clostridiales bacterium]
MKNGTKFFLYIVFWFALVTFFCVITARQLVNYSESEEEAAIISAQLTEARKESVALAQERAYRGSDEFVEKIARDKLGFVKPGEILFFLDEEPR